MQYKLFVALALAGCITGDDAALESDSLQENVSQTTQHVGLLASSGPYFATPMFWNYDVRSTPKAANSATIISSLKAAGGWGNGNIFQIDFSLNVLTASSTTPKRSWTKNSMFYSPDCDYSQVPVPAGGNVEGNSGYTCSTGGDCHLIVYDTSRRSCTSTTRRASRRPRTPAAASPYGTARRRIRRSCAVSSARARTPRASRSHRSSSPPTK
jgi:hypothetical protein